MNLWKAAANALGVFALAATLASPASAADSAKMTYGFFMNPVEIPGGKVVPAGLYAFKIVDETPTNKVIQILTSLPGKFAPDQPRQRECVRGAGTDVGGRYHRRGSRLQESARQCARDLLSGARR